MTIVDCAFAHEVSTSPAWPISVMEQLENPSESSSPAALVHVSVSGSEK